MFSSSMIAPLSDAQQEFLTVMGLADEFTVEMALFITGNPKAGQILSLMTRQNAFITPLPDGVSFRFHHMMKDVHSVPLPCFPMKTDRFPESLRTMV